MNSFILKQDNQKIYYISEQEYGRTDKRYSWNVIQFKWYKIIWKILTDRRFRVELKETILYALRWQDNIRGTGSADVMLFESHYAEHIFKIKEELT